MRRTSGLRIHYHASHGRGDQVLGDVESLGDVQVHHAEPVMLQLLQLTSMIVKATTVVLQMLQLQEAVPLPDHLAPVPTVGRAMAAMSLSQRRKTKGLRRTRGNLPCLHHLSLPHPPQKKLPC